MAVLLVLGVIGHPFRPAHFAACVKGAMPLEPPQLLDRHMSYGVIHKHSLDTSIMPVHGEVFHLLVVAAPLAVILRRRHPRSEWPATAPHHVHEHRDLVQVVAGRVDRAPMPIFFSALYVPRCVVKPVVVAITRTRGNRLA